MSGGNRKIPRTHRSFPCTQNTAHNMSAHFSNLPDSSGVPGGSNDENNTYATLPKHIPFPEVPHNSDILNELWMFVFTILAAATQFLHLYRTVWWLPNSHTHQTMNLYLVDDFLAAFIALMLGRRVVFCILDKIIGFICPKNFVTNVKKGAKFIYFHGLIALLSMCCVQIFHKHSYMYIFCLCYPLIVYVLIFGMQVEPFLKTTNIKDKAYLNGLPYHCCSTIPNSVRTEIDVLKTDFNNRFKQVFFTSILNAYYAGFIPCCFAQNFVYYDIYWATQHLGFVWIGGLTMCIVYCFPAKYCDVLHRASLHLGQWSRVDNRINLQSAIPWTKTLICPPGTIVKHLGDYYKASGPNTVAVPANSSHYRFYAIFQNPAFLYLVLCGFQTCVVVLQLLILFFSREWHNTLSLSYLLLVNQYTLFQIARDYLVTKKIYSTESTNFENSNGSVN